MLERHLQQLIQDLKIDLIPVKNEKGFYSLDINENLSIEFKDIDPGTYFFSKICKPPKEKKEDLFALLMKANFLGQGTLGAAIGLDQDENFLTLSLAIPYDMNYRLFRDEVEDFTNIVDYWREEVRRYEAAMKENILSPKSDS